MINVSKLGALSFSLPITLFAIVMLFSPFSAISETTVPGNVIRTTIDKARSFVETQRGSTSEDQLKIKLESIIFPIFDFHEMARRSLGKNWKACSKEEQTEYVDLFSKLLSRTYYKKVVDNIDKSEISYLEEKTHGRKAMVKTSIVYEGQTAAVDYRMFEKKSGWFIYDIVIENIGLVNNYRSEFSSIIRKEKIPGLLEKLREKVNNPAKEDA